MLHMASLWLMMVSSVVADICGTEYNVTYGCDTVYGMRLGTAYDVRSAIECCGWCWSHNFCVSVKYDAVNKACYLNAERYQVLGTDCPVKLRYSQVTKRSCHQLINQACTKPKECWPANSECFQGICQCFPGHTYNTDTENCHVITMPCASEDGPLEEEGDFLDPHDRIPC